MVGVTLDTHLVSSSQPTADTSQRMPHSPQERHACRLGLLPASSRNARQLHDLDNEIKSEPSPVVTYEICFLFIFLIRVKDPQTKFTMSTVCKCVA